MKMQRIPFNKVNLTEVEISAIAVLDSMSLSGNGKLSNKCQDWLEQYIHYSKALLTPSCTAALEMTVHLIDIQSGDEVIMPSFTFVSTANAVVLRGGIPVFVDVRSDTLNLDETKIEAAITPKTKAIMPVHYAGVGCEMDAIMQIARKHNLYVIEDNAQGIMSRYKNKPLGSFGQLSALSFHETKNITCGEGGALSINDSAFIERAEIIREKGTNRSQFYRGQVDKYTWVDIGSSYLPNELTAAFLLAQLEQAEEITNRRLVIWNNYHAAFEQLEQDGRLRRPIVPEYCQHNGHIYYLLLSDLTERTRFINYLDDKGISSVFHYVPLHSSPAGKKYGRVSGELKNTEWASDCLVRLPLWVGLEEHQDRVIQAVLQFFK